MKSLTLKSFAAVSVALTLGACAAITGGYRNVTAEQLERIHAGLTQDEVRSIAGTPPTYAHNPLTGATEWSYTFVDEWGYESEFSVDFDANGTVTEAMADRTRD